jgi:hypothetical protein
MVVLMSQRTHPFRVMEVLAAPASLEAPSRKELAHGHLAINHFGIPPMEGRFWVLSAHAPACLLSFSGGDSKVIKPKEPREKSQSKLCPLCPAGAWAS